MYCPKCGYEIGDEEYCLGCNTPVKELFGEECKARCFICGELINFGDKFCRGCGISDPLVVPLESGSDGDDIYCWECGAEFIGGRCPNCGFDEEDFKEHISSAETKKCPTCGEEICVKDKYCHICGNEISFESVPETKAVFCKNCGMEFENGECPLCGEKQEDAFGKGDTKVCPNCFEFVDEYADFCPVCGKRFEKKQKTTSSEGYKKPVYDDDVPAPDAFLWFMLGLAQLLICCNPFAIGTIVCANKAMKKIKAGNNREAQRNVKAAIIWFISGFASVALIVAFNFILAAF